MAMNQPPMGQDPTGLASQVPGGQGSSNAYTQQSNPQITPDGPMQPQQPQTQPEQLDIMLQMHLKMTMIGLLMDMQNVLKSEANMHEKMKAIPLQAQAVNTLHAAFTATESLEVEKQKPDNSQFEAQLKQQEAQHKYALDLMSMQQEEQIAKQKMELEAQKMQLEMQIKQVEAQIKAQGMQQDLQHKAEVHESNLEQQQIQKATSIQQAQQQEENHQQTMEQQGEVHQKSMTETAKSDEK